MSPAPPKTSSAKEKSLTVQARTERCAAHQKVRTGEDTATFELLGQVIHMLDDLTTSVSEIGEAVSRVTADLAGVSALSRETEKQVEVMAKVGEALTSVANTNSRNIEDIRKRLG